MNTIKSDLQSRTWTKDNLFVSTDWTLIPISQVNAAFASDVFYWANPVPDDVMRETLENSLCFGLYEILMKPAVDNESSSTKLPEKSDLKFLGLARCVTDYTTFVYLTDVYIEPGHQGGGLGKWLVACVREVLEEMPYLRRSLLFTGDWQRSVPFYMKNMKMTVYESEKAPDGKTGAGLAIMQRLGRGHPHYKEGD